MRYVVLGLVAALCGCSVVSDILGNNVAGDADVQGRVLQSSGQPLAQSTVVIACAGMAAQTTPTDTVGRYAVNLLAPAAGGRRCTFGVPDLTTPRIRVDTSLGFAPLGQLHAMQTIDLREP